MKITLRQGAYALELNTHGGEMNSLKKEELEFLWQGDPQFWAGQAPVCFPIVGSLRENEANALGRPCHMGRHGVARKEEFSLIRQSENEAVFSLRANETTMAQYPFDFELLISYVLGESGVDILYEVRNHGTGPMPFTIGGHPAFRCPLRPGEAFEEYEIRFEQKETVSCLRPDLHTGLMDVSRREPVLEDSDVLPLCHTLFDRDSMVFDELRSRRVSLRHRVNGSGITLSFPDFPYLLIWSAQNNAPFVALEPWTGMATCTDEGDALEEKRGMALLEPGKLVRYRYSIVLMD